MAPESHSSLDDDASQHGRHHRRRPLSHSGDHKSELPRDPLFVTAANAAAAASKSAAAMATAPDSDHLQREPRSHSPRVSERSRSIALEYFFCALGIYACFLSWGVLQERISTSLYPRSSLSVDLLFRNFLPPSNNDIVDEDPSSAASSPAHFKDFVFLNLCQAIIATAVGLIYLAITSLRSKGSRDCKSHQNSLEKSDSYVAQRRMKSRDLFKRILFVAFASAIASPFGYASLRHVDYPTMLLAKSCKLLPVLVASVVVHRRSFPPAQYLAVILVSLGVSLFVMAGPKRKASAANSSSSSSSPFGILLLVCNLAFDGLTNSAQDAIFRIHRLSGFAMMVAQNALAALLMAIYLLTPPQLVDAINFTNSNASAASSAASASADATVAPMTAALTFISERPSVVPDILLFALCGALGQIFIFYTLSRFGSLSLVTITVTRKMFSIILSVIVYSHALRPLQWLAVCLVFVGVIFEAYSKPKKSSCGSSSSPNTAKKRD